MCGVRLNTPARGGARVRAGEDGDVGRPRAGQELNDIKQQGPQVTILIYDQSAILVQRKVHFVR